MKTNVQPISVTTESSSAEVTPAAEPHSPPRSSRLWKWLRQLFGMCPEATLKEALEEVIEEHEEETAERMEPEEKVMLHNVLSFGEITVKDIMVPRTDIAAVPDNVTLDQLKKHLLEQRHTRIPVYHDTLDKVQGFIHVKDLLPMLAGDMPFDIKTAMRTLVFVAPAMRILDLLVKMRHAGSHMAIVVDEYGGTDGLVTMEDIFERIVGDIQDEHDEDEEQSDTIVQVRDKVYEVSARIRIEKLEKQLGLTLVTEEKEDEFDTLGGLIFFQLGRVPAKAEIIPHVSGVKFEIIDADSRRIRRVRILAA